MYYGIIGIFSYEILFQCCRHLIFLWNFISVLPTPRCDSQQEQSLDQVIKEAKLFDLEKLVAKKRVSMTVEGQGQNLAPGVQENLAPGGQGDLAPGGQGDLGPAGPPTDLGAPMGSMEDLNDLSENDSLLGNSPPDFSDEELINFITSKGRRKKTDRSFELAAAKQGSLLSIGKIF
jgi:hypothetical protein